MNLSTNLSRRALILSALIVSLLAPGCVSMWSGDEMREDIAALQAEQKATQESLESEKERLTEMISSARGEVKELQEVLKEARSLLQRNNADLGVEVQKNREQAGALYGKIEELEFKVGKIDQEIDLFKEDVDLRFGTADKSLPDSAGPLFEKGEKEYKANNMRVARRAFEKFKEQFSRDKRAPQAQLLLGMTYYRESQWASAIFELQQVIKEHGSSSVVDEATYQIALALRKMERCDQASAWFELLLDEHPQSEWAESARQQLKEIEAGKCG